MYDMYVCMHMSTAAPASATEPTLSPVVPASAPTSTETDGLEICPICVKPVLDINPGGEIVCDGCEQWLHLRCMGKTKRWARRIREFHCDLCKDL